MALRGGGRVREVGEGTQRARTASCEISHEEAAHSMRAIVSNAACIFHSCSESRPQKFSPQGKNKIL